MHSSSYIVLKSLLPESLQANMLQFLSDRSQTVFKKTPTFQTKIELSKFDLTDLLKHVHYSWLLPVFHTISLKEQIFFLTALSQNSFLKIQKNLKQETLKPVLSFLAVDYFKKKLLAKLLENHPALLPKAYLPASPLSFLLDFDKTQLLELINLLSLFDLAKEYFKIINKATLQKLDTLLSSKEKLFLKKKRHYQDALMMAPLHLDKFKGDVVAFKALLHKRGLIRLSKALSSLYFDFIWHIAHTLDIGRGQVLLELTKQEENPKIIHLCQQNILELMPLMQSEV